MIASSEAERIIKKHLLKLDVETVPLEQSLGRILAEDIIADRDIPPCNRSTMDGIAIKYSTALHNETFEIKNIQAAGDRPVKIVEKGQCIQVMTGACVPKGLDTVIPIEEVKIVANQAKVLQKDAKIGQFIHLAGSDKQKNSQLVLKGTEVSSSVIAIAATVGKSKLKVVKPPKTLIVTTGDEVIQVKNNPKTYHIRRSNDLMLTSILSRFFIKPEVVHLSDNKQILKKVLKPAVLKYELIIMSGGVSKGEFDFIPQVLAELSVSKHFHGVKQKPGKPLWFGSHKRGATVFALPGNPVSSYLCAVKYLNPYLRDSYGVKHVEPIYALLPQDISFTSKLTYFARVKLSTSNKGQIIATPVKDNGSGDIVSLLSADGFIELPANKSTFKKGETYKIILL